MTTNEQEAVRHVSEFLDHLKSGNENLIVDGKTFYAGDLEDDLEILLSRWATSSEPSPK